MVSMHVVVTGRVQGVGFRWFVRQNAQRRGVTGWVMNRPDGSVEIAATGSEAAIDQLRRDITEGPPGASVLEVKDLAPIPDEDMRSTFSVRR